MLPRLSGLLASSGASLSRVGAILDAGWTVTFFVECQLISVEGSVSPFPTDKTEVLFLLEYTRKKTRLYEGVNTGWVLSIGDLCLCFAWVAVQCGGVA